MKFALCFLLAFGLFASSKSAAVGVAQKRAIDPVTASMIMSAAKPIVEKFIGLANDLFFKPLFANQIGRNYHDDIIMGRAVRITKVDDTTVTILDRASGVKTTGTGANGQEAIENGTKALLETLLLTGKMSLLDLGIQPAVVTTEQPCYDKHPKSYCEEMEGNGLCSPGHQMATFMKTYCFKTCGGC
ncbi:uncharacterized protein LOC135486099 isoform X2 [Lineus longissimus]|uniref:uncharacterized protein LOC135486099 isoform X2 n=1 Tax=Lineus longissimus TaxID=88925 RepID=UPI002B4C3716